MTDTTEIFTRTETEVTCIVDGWGTDAPMGRDAEDALCRLMEEYCDDTDAVRIYVVRMPRAGEAAGTYLGIGADLRPLHCADVYEQDEIREILNAGWEHALQAYEPVQYVLRAECGTEQVLGDEVADDDAANRAADTWARGGAYDEITSTVWVDTTVTIGERSWVRTTVIDPKAPACRTKEGHHEPDGEHEWMEAGEPGFGTVVRGAGPGVEHREVCYWCGCERLSVTNAQRPDTGAQTADTSVRYVELPDADAYRLTVEGGMRRVSSLGDAARVMMYGDHGGRVDVTDADGCVVGWASAGIWRAA